METFLTWTFPPEVRNLATLLFLWSGVAIWVGLIARIPFRGRTVVQGPWLTFCVGFVGSSLGPFVARAFFKLKQFDPISPAGFVSALAFAFVALALFYVMSFLFPIRDDEYEDERNVEEAEEYEEIYDARRREPQRDEWEYSQRVREYGDRYDDRPIRRRR